MAAFGVGALEAGESGGEIAATEEVLDGFDGEGAELAVDLAVIGFVIAEEVGPSRVPTMGIMVNRE